LRYAIYPPIGLARLGNSPTEVFVGPEQPGQPGFDIDLAGNETPLSHYKVDEVQIKRQAARFRLFEIGDSGAPQPASLPAGAKVEWTVHLVNKKASVARPPRPTPEPRRPQWSANPGPSLIDPGKRSILGAGAALFDSGEFQGRRVPLGGLRSDRDQNLLVVGGFGFSSSPNLAPLREFYTNPGWHDDVSDGPVTARIHLPNGSTVDDIKPAWVIVAPPDFAPEIQPAVTMYDIMLEVGIDHLGVPRPSQVSFTRDVFPLLLRTQRLQWVNQAADWEEISADWQALADTSAASAQLRQKNAKLVLDIEDQSILSRFMFPKHLRWALNEWSAGRFSSDWHGIPQPATSITAEGLTRASLETTVGRGFYPGIEAGILMRDPKIYAAPFDFRLDHSQLNPGDLTALMALPWQADFLDCSGNWWPSQRPDNVRRDASSPQEVLWNRGVTTYLQMVHDFSKLGFIVAQKDTAGNIVFAEQQRAGSDFIV
jgi:hypothetical protein